MRRKKSIFAVLLLALSVSGAQASELYPRRRAARRSLESASMQASSLGLVVEEARVMTARARSLEVGSPERIELATEAARRFAELGCPWFEEEALRLDGHASRAEQ